jgi:hypothetical protein
MTHPTTLPRRQRRTTASPPPRTDRVRATRRAALVAGVSLLLLAALAVFGNFVAVEGLVTRGDAARTAADVAASLGTFRLGVAALLGAVALDVVVAWSLQVFFRPVDRRLSLLAGAARLVYAGVFLAAVVQLARVPGLVGAGGDAMPAQVMARVDSFDRLWSAGLLLFGLHLLLVGLLAYRSGYVPRLLGILLLVAGAGYVVDTAVAALSTGSPFEVSTVTFVGELLLAIWLVVRGPRVSIETVRS